MTPTVRGLVLPALLNVVSLGAPSAASEPSFFSARVAPILTKHCAECHNATKSRGGLSLISRADLLRGGAQGPAIVPGKSDDSLLLKLVSGDKPKMPRKGSPLTSEQIALLRKWIDDGAAWPDGVTLSGKEGRPIIDAKGWSLRSLERPAVPAVKAKEWVRNPVDAFVLAMLEAKGLRPSPEADRATLIRRLTFDLHGLPPTPEEIKAFVEDKSPDACELLIERLLASPRYGERWGRHWLDIVHYGDTHGYDKDKRRDHAWPYRDYVIRAFNKDKPYPRFIREQLAGDFLYPDDPDGVVASGFIAAGPWDFVGHVELREGTVDKLKTRLLDRDDMVSSTMSTFVSLTVHCARCHDHKFDPIPQQDYYALQAVFAGVERGDRPYEPPERAARRATLARQQKELEARRAELAKALDRRSSPELAEADTLLRKLRQDLAALPSPAQVYAVIPIPPRPIHVLARGDVEKPGPAAAAGSLRCVAGLSPFRLPDRAAEGARRAALADWIADRKNPLTWRSIANRVWQYHFGRALVDTPNDFGGNGSRPTHPELLDWLAGEVRDKGGSLKQLHRLIVSSAAYRQSSRYDEAMAKRDADNRYLWRMNRRRLDAESVRDSVLAVSGKLDLKMGGPGFELFRFKDDHSPIYDHTALEKIHDPATYRRTVYRFTVRSVPNPFLDCLDCADPNINTPVRNTTLTALQALALLNDPFMLKQAEFFAERLRKASAEPGRQIEQGFLLAFGRPPTREERDALLAYVRKHGLVSACRLLFNANEFVFVD